jgi:hypothetical protein
MCANRSLTQSQKSRLHPKIRAASTETPGDGCEIGRDEVGIGLKSIASRAG